VKGESTGVVDRTERPVLSGILALVGVGLAVGLILGLGALVVARMAGVGGGEDGSGASSERSMYLPPPEKTEEPSSLPRQDGGGQPGGEKSSDAADTVITLTSGQPNVAPMQQIDLRGSYPGGDGAILRVQRFQGGSWVEFPVTASVSGGSFSTYVQTGQGGVNRFRVYDADAREASNAVKVRVG
jgi:hypothetical protein